jgi:PAS domain S-box-containing protein
MDPDGNLCELLVSQAPDAIIFADREGEIRVWNERATAIFGYGMDEALGHSLDLIIPQHLRYAHWEGFNCALASGHTRMDRQALKTRAVPKSGERLYVTLAFGVVKDRNGNPIGAIATAREFGEKHA